MLEGGSIHPTRRILLLTSHTSHSRDPPDFDHINLKVYALKAMMTKTFLILIFDVRNVFILQGLRLQRSHGLSAEGTKDKVKQAKE